MTPDQCSRCDAVADCIDEGIATLEDVAGVIGCPTPSLHVHLVQHDRDDLLHRLTYGGEPILPPKLEETTVVLPPAVEHEVAKDPGTFEVEVDDAVHAEIIDEDPGELVDLAGWPEQPAETLTGPDVDRAVMTPVLQNLAGYHPSEDVRCAAESLLSALGEWEQDLEARTRLEQLVAQRDQLNAEIEELAARLGDTETAPPALDPLRRSEKPVRNLSAQELGVADDGPPARVVRAWCRENGVPCPATGRVPRSAVEAWRAAHS